MSEKKIPDYQKLTKHLDIAPQELLMIGNSLKSDILPLIAIGASAIHVPFHTTWTHEQVSEQDLLNSDYTTVSSIRDILALL